MLKTSLYKIIGVIACILCVWAVSPWAMALNVDSVRFGQQPDNIARIVIELDERTAFRSFVLADPYRLVVDLPHFDWRAGKPQIQSHPLIRDIRQGALSNDASRIVFDTTKPVRIDSAFVLRAHNGKPNRLVIDYKQTSARNFAAHKGKIFGTFTVDTQPIAPSQDTETGTHSSPYVLTIPMPPPNSQRPVRQDSVTEIAATSPTPNRTTPKAKPLIVLDPGHGGQDPGAIGSNKLKEKTVVLALGKEIRRQLLATGRYRVAMTRESDVFIKLRDRVAFARNKQADLFVSIHADSIHKKNVSGTSIYTLSRKASDAQTAKLAEKENRADLIAGVEVEIEDEQVAFILGDFLVTDTMNQSKFFANTVVSKLQSQRIKTLTNPHRYAGFAVLKAPDIPSILIEAGFMSNDREAQLLSQPAHRQKLANAIVYGINAYFDHVEKNENSY